MGEMKITWPTDWDLDEIWDETLHMEGGAGDVKAIWDKDNEDEVAAARETYEKLRKKGYAAYRVDNDGDRDGIMREFDPDAERIILRPRVAGG